MTSTEKMIQVLSALNDDRDVRAAIGSVRPDLLCELTDVACTLEPRRNAKIDEALRSGSAESKTVKQMIDQGLAIDAGDGGWIRTVRGQAVATQLEALEHDVLARLEAEELERADACAGSDREWDFAVKGGA